MDHRGTILMLRIVACIVLAAALGAFFGELRSLPNLDGVSILLPLGLLVMGGGVAAILVGLAAILQQRPHSNSSESVASAGVLAQNQLIELSLKMEDVAASVDRLARERAASPAPAAHVPPGEQPSTQNPAVLVALQRLFEELRDLSLLTDEQRRERSAQIKEQQKLAAIDSATALVHARQWIDAQKAIEQIETEWPADPAVSSLRAELSAAREIAANEALGIAEAQIESEMSLSHWDHAAILARKLSHDFPSNERAAKLLHRVEREKAIYTEATVGRLYEEIRHDVERRVWRRALAHAQTLLEKFPDHPRSELIRKQVKTIGDNAEIEERQEQELRIGELIRSRRFEEAIALSQELLQRFPLSPQAEAIQKLLPRIQQMAAEAHSHSTQSSSA